jgi:hypothetical protein
MARPSKKTPTTEERICEALRLGATYKLAAMAGGISYETLNNWLRAAEAGDERYVPFLQAVQAAETEAFLDALKVIKRSKDAKVKLELLSRRYPSEFGTRNHLTLAGDADEPIAVKTVTFVAPGGEGVEEAS